MFKSSWRTLLVPLVVAFVSLLSGIFLRGMIIHDFQRHIDDEHLVLVRMVSSDLEGAYAKFGTWNGEDANEDFLRALMLGMRLKLVNAREELVLTTEEVVAQLPLAKKERILADTGFSTDGRGTKYRSYPLMRGDERVGRLEVMFLQAGGPDDAGLLSGAFVLAWLLLFSGPTFALGFLILRKPSQPVGTPSPAVAEDRGEDLNAVTAVPKSDEAADLPDTQVMEIGKEIPSKGEYAAISVVGDKEDEPVVITKDGDDIDSAGGTDDAYDINGADDDGADDADMQPLAGDPDRITRIVEGLNKLARAQTLGRALQKQPVEIATFLTTIIEKARGSVRDKDITFNLECQNGLTLPADPDCLTGIIENLIDNAVKAIKNDGTVTVSAETRGDHAVFTVKDTGTGIRRKDVPHLFEQYYRASGSGIGLGLTIVKELVNACGGSVKVQTTRGKGSAFIVVLPGS